MRRAVCGVYKRTFWSYPESIGQATADTRRERTGDDATRDEDTEEHADARRPSARAPTRDRGPETRETRDAGRGVETPR